MFFFFHYQWPCRQSFSRVRSNLTGLVGSCLTRTGPRYFAGVSTRDTLEVCRLVPLDHREFESHFTRPGPTREIEKTGDPTRPDP